MIEARQCDKVCCHAIFYAVIGFVGIFEKCDRFYSIRKLYYCVFMCFFNWAKTVTLLNINKFIYHIYILYKGLRTGNSVTESCRALSRHLTCWRMA